LHISYVHRVARPNHRLYQAALRYELGDSHVYEFVEGTVATDIAPELRENFSVADEFFAYADLREPASCAAALDQLNSYVAAEGPFDGVLAFSQGAALAVTYLAQKWAQQPSIERLSPTFKCAILFSSRDAHRSTMQRLVDVGFPTANSEAELIQIPSAHVWGRNDPDIDGPNVTSLFTASGREEYIHEGGHEIPGARMNTAVKSSVQIIRRVVTAVLHKQM
jgi:hypothetical protein